MQKAKEARRKEALEERLSGLRPNERAEEVRLESDNLFTAIG